MKLTKLEGASIAVTAAALVLMTGFFLGSGSGTGRVMVTELQLPGRSAPPSASAEASPSVGAEAPAPDPDEEKKEISFPIDINTATEEELQALPGIGQTRAQAIVAYREEHGPFRYVENLREVAGIGEGTLEKIMDYVTVGEVDADG